MLREQKKRNLKVCNTFYDIILSTTFAIVVGSNWAIMKYNECFNAGAWIKKKCGLNGYNL